MNHEEAQKFLHNYLQTTGKHSVMNQAIARLLHDWHQAYELFEGLAELNNYAGNKRLEEAGKFDQFNSPLTVELTRRFIQNL